MNGTIIPEDTANALTFNGTNITDVFMNGTQVWKQQLFSATWSGSSTGTYGIGIVTSGNQYHWDQYLDGAGATQHVNSDGTFSGNSYAKHLSGISVSGNLWRAAYNGQYGSWITFNKSSGFSGGPSSAYKKTFRTSGGSLRSEWNGSLGAWITLT